MQQCPMCGNTDDSTFSVKEFNATVHEVRRGKKQERLSRQWLYRCTRCGMTWTVGSEDIPQEKEEDESAGPKA